MRKVRRGRLGKDSNSDCKGLSQRSASGIFLLTFLCVWTFVHLANFSFFPSTRPQPTAQPSFYPLCVQLVAPFSAIYPLAGGGLERIDRETVKYSVAIYIAKKRGRSDILVYQDPDIKSCQSLCIEDDSREIHCTRCCRMRLYARDTRMDVPRKTGGTIVREWFNILAKFFSTCQ